MVVKLRNVCISIPLSKYRGVYKIVHIRFILAYIVPLFQLSRAVQVVASGILQHHLQKNLGQDGGMVESWNDELFDASLPRGKKLLVYSSNFSSPTPRITHHVCLSSAMKQVTSNKYNVPIDYSSGPSCECPCASVVMWYLGIRMLEVSNSD